MSDIEIIKKMMYAETLDERSMLMKEAKAALERLQKEMSKLAAWSQWMPDNRTIVRKAVRLSMDIGYRKAQKQAACRLRKMAEAFDYSRKDERPLAGVLLHAEEDIINMEQVDGDNSGYNYK